MKSSRAKLFRNGSSQAVRLPRDCQFKADTEIVVRREGRRVVIEPKDEWSAKFRACLGAWSDDIPRPKQRQIRHVQNPLA